MQYIYHQEASKEFLTVDKKLYKYLFKVRRFKINDKLNFRNLTDLNLYYYQIIYIDKKTAKLRLLKTVTEIDTNTTIEKKIHLIWCVIDPKIIDKTLPLLNQIGVSKITFVYCHRSQQNFKLNFERMKEILINSSQQCGRTNIIELEIMKSLDTVLKEYPNISVLDFGGECEWKNISTVLIGCEGGFSEHERKILDKQPKIAFKTKLILKSETAAIAFSSKVLI